RAAREGRRNLDDLRYLPIPLPTGGTVPLGSIAEIGDRLGPIDIEREDQRRYARLSITKTEDVDLGTLTARVSERVNATDLPEGMHIEIGGVAEDLQDSFIKLGLALIAALFLVYM